MPFTRTVPAKKLTPAYRFKMGGCMYQITDVHPNDFNDRVIHAFDLLDPDCDVIIIVGKDAHFKVYPLDK